MAMPIAASTISEITTYRPVRPGLVAGEPSIGCDARCASVCARMLVCDAKPCTGVCLNWSELLASGMSAGAGSDALRAVGIARGVTLYCIDADALVAKGDITPVGGTVVSATP